jgi:hypothetical protein
MARTQRQKWFKELTSLLSLHMSSLVVLFMETVPKCFILFGKISTTTRKIRICILLPLLILVSLCRITSSVKPSLDFCLHDAYSFLFNFLLILVLVIHLYNRTSLVHTVEIRLQFLTCPFLLSDTRRRIFLPRLQYHRS